MILDSFCATHWIDIKCESPSIQISGIIREAVDHIFDAIEQEKNKQFLLRVSYMEIYNDEVSDLLAPKQSRKDTKTDRKSKGLRILDDEDGAVNIEGK